MRGVDGSIGSEGGSGIGGDGGAAYQISHLHIPRGRGRVVKHEGLCGAARIALGAREHGRRLVLAQVAVGLELQAGRLFVAVDEKHAAAGHGLEVPQGPAVNFVFVVRALEPLRLAGRLEREAVGKTGREEGLVTAAQKQRRR